MGKHDAERGKSTAVACRNGLSAGPNKTIHSSIVKSDIRTEARRIAANIAKLLELFRR